MVQIHPHDFQKTLKKQTPWEIVVWDWTKCTSDPNIECTPKSDFDPQDVIKDARTAYDNVIKYDLGLRLATAIANHRYKHVHLIAHSAGANLIHSAATKLAGIYKQRNEEPFIHLTFLDAFTLSDFDKASYGFLANYPNHYSEHYVNRGFALDPASTDACLGSAFNFDITGWEPVSHHDPDEKRDFGHQWPRYWYEKSVTFPPVGPTSPGFAYGYRLSLEGSGKDINELVNELAKYPAGQQCPLSGEDTNCQPADCWK